MVCLSSQSELNLNTEYQSFSSSTALTFRSNRTASVLGALDTKLDEIETSEKQKKEKLLAHDLNRQSIVNELLLAQQNSLASQAQSKLPSSAASSAAQKRNVLSSMLPPERGPNAQTSSQGGGSQAQSASQGASQVGSQSQSVPPSYGEEMDVDPTPLTPAKETSRKKPAGSSPSTGSGPAVRKRARGGQ